MTEGECRRSRQFITEIKVKASTDLKGESQSIIREWGESGGHRERNRSRHGEREMTIMEKESDGRM